MRYYLMMLSIDVILQYIAPHNCMVCGDEGAIVCAWCLPDFALPVPSRCFLCKVVTTDSRVCVRCRRKSALKHVWVRSTYEGRVKNLVHEFKFERKQAAAIPIATLMRESLPFLPQDTIIAHVPTATSRVRRRGYDHAELLAKQLARHLHLTHETLLLRRTQTRQVGAKRAQRFRQMEGAFVLRDFRSLQDATVLLVDDLTTTGSTLEAAARCLKDGGVKTVNAVVFAQK